MVYPTSRTTAAETQAAGELSGKNSGGVEWDLTDVDSELELVAGLCRVVHRPRRGKRSTS